MRCTTRPVRRTTSASPRGTGEHEGAFERGDERGRERRGFAERFVAARIQFHIEDILVNGPPWHLRVALRAHDYIPAPDGGPDEYNNRAVAFLEMRWGRLVRWEDYEDTERVAAWDRRQADATRSTVG